MTCEQRAPEILLFAAGVLEGEADTDMAAHLRAGCAACESELVSARALLAELSSSLDPVEPSAAVRERLLARVAGQQAAARAEASARSGWGRLALAAGLAAVVAAGLSVGLFDRLAAEPLRSEIARLEAESHSLLAGRQDLEARLSELEALQAEQDSELADLEGTLARREELVELLHAPDLEMLVLVAAPTQPGARARVFWEWEDYACYLHATGLAAPPQGRVYMLWLLAEDGRWVRAGELSPGASGETSFFTRLSRDTGRVSQARVTLESAADADEPTGEVQLSGRLL